MRELERARATGVRLDGHTQRETRTRFGRAHCAGVVHAQQANTNGAVAEDRYALCTSAIGNTEEFKEGIAVDTPVLRRDRGCASIATRISHRGDS